jgi:hypothetical protein
MGFVRDVATAGTYGLAGLLANHKKKPVIPQPTMISNTPYERPMSMIGSPRGGS